MVTLAVADPSGTVHAVCGNNPPTVTRGVTMLSGKNADPVFLQPVSVRVAVTE